MLLYMLYNTGYGHAPLYIFNRYDLTDEFFVGRLSEPSSIVIFWAEHGLESPTRGHALRQTQRVEDHRRETLPRLFMIDIYTYIYTIRYIVSCFGHRLYVYTIWDSCAFYMCKRPNIWLGPAFKNLKNSCCVTFMHPEIAR